jgi:16S rRNA (guanine(1405)-N(7))-methyltransferase
MDELDRLVQAVLKSPKYRNICQDVVRNLGARELAVQRSWKEAVKATKSKLHQVGGAYLDARMDYTRWLDELQAAATGEDTDSFHRACWEAMEHHSSTRERLGILDQFYELTLADLPAIDVVLDVACGLNPLAIPWMPLGRDVLYYAYDIYSDMVAFLVRFMSIANVRGQAQARDVTQSPPARRADLAFILKSLPCIEHLDKSASGRLLEAINADHLLISFPVRSLGGRDKGMAHNYEARFWELMAGKQWSVQRFEFATELAFLVSK